MLFGKAGGTHAVQQRERGKRSIIDRSADGERGDRQAQDIEGEGGATLIAGKCDTGSTDVSSAEGSTETEESATGRKGRQLKTMSEKEQARSNRSRKERVTNSVGTDASEEQAVRPVGADAWSSGEQSLQTDDAEAQRNEPRPRGRSRRRSRSERPHGKGSVDRGPTRGAANAVATPRLSYVRGSHHSTTDGLHLKVPRTEDCVRGGPLRGQRPAQGRRQAAKLYAR